MPNVEVYEMQKKFEKWSALEMTFREHHVTGHTNCMGRTEPHRGSTSYSTKVNAPNLLNELSNYLYEEASN